MPQRRLEDRIQALVAQAVATQNVAELEGIIRQLRSALHEHANRLRKLAAANLVATQLKSSSAGVLQESVTMNDVSTD